MMKPSGKQLHCIVALSVLLSACGGGSSGSGNNDNAPPANNPPTTNPPPVTPPPTTALFMPGERGYLQNSELALGSFDAALASASGLTITQESGPAMRFALGAQNILYFLSPEEQFADSNSVLKITDGTSTWSLTFNWAGRQSISLTRLGEADENGNAPAPDNVTLKSNGIAPDATIDATAAASLSFEIQNAPAIDPTISTISLNSPTGSEDITGWFNYDSSTHIYALQPASVMQFVTALRNAKTATITFSLSTTDYQQTFGFEQALRYAGGSINVELRNANNSPASDLGGAEFVARGFNTGTLKLGQANSSGLISFSGLPADTYEISQVLLGPGIRLTGFATVNDPDTPTVLIITKGSEPVAGSLGNQKSFSAKSLAPVKAPANPLRQRTATNPTLKRTQKAPLANAAYKTIVVADEQDTLITRPVSYAVPQGTTSLGIRVEIFSEEYPDFTTIQSQYNDIWMYNIRLPAPLASLAKSGKVNQTHATTGTIAFEQCIAIPANLSSTGFSITGSIGAQNVADALLSTSVEVSVNTTCANTLAISEFAGTAKTPDGLFSLYPRRTAINESAPDGNIAGQYLSIPISTILPESFGIPATLKYTPSDASLTAIEIYQRTGAGDVSLGSTYLSQTTQAGAGLLTFSGLRLSPTNIAQTSGRVQLVAVLRGTVQGIAAQSEPFPLSIGDFTNYSPIYLTSELAGYSDGNRFGTHTESGGDSWATNGMATWLFASGLRYNDISAGMIKQLAGPAYRSVLGHSGHSDAQQADIRYWDGSGGFTDTLGGANNGAGISALANAALNEVNTNAASKPNLSALTAWIVQNRSNLQTYAIDSTVRRIYIGNQHIAQLLIQGKFPGTNTIVPGVAVWSPKPAKISVQPSHLDHWHVSTNNL